MRQIASFPQKKNTFLRPQLWVQRELWAQQQRCPGHCAGFYYKFYVILLHRSATQSVYLHYLISLQVRFVLVVCHPFSAAIPLLVENN